MRPPLPPRVAWFIVLACSVFAARTAAQTVLMVVDDKKGLPVRTVRGSRPCVEKDGKLVVSDGDRFALLSVDEFLPAFVAVRNLRVKTTSLEMMDSGSSINNQFEFHADFESSYPLDDVFVVLELIFEDKSKNLFLHEVGHLERDHPRSLDLAVRMGYPLGRGHYFLHLYSNGMEVMHSEQPFANREGALDRMIAKRNNGRADGPPQPFIGPPPEYPAKLLKAKIKGRALIRLTIRSTGAVIDPVVVEASDPAFGESAVESMRQWRFLPKIKNGRAVDTVATMPLDFAPPSPAEKS